LPYWTHRAPHSASIPGKLIAQNVTNQWHRLYHTKLSYVIGDHHLLNNVSAFSKDRPIPYYDFDLRQSPWINLNDLKKHGGVILLWLGRYANQTNIAYAKKCFPDVTHIQTQNYHRLTGANVPEITVWTGFVPPAKA
jgi:hypothetical protein